MKQKMAPAKKTQLKPAKKAKQEKHSVFGMIGLSFQRLFENALIMLPFLFNLIATGIIIVILFLIAGLGLAFAAVEPDVSTLLSPSFILTATIGFLAIWLIGCYFSSGAVGMALDIMKGKKTSLGAMHYYGKRFFFRYWLIGLLIGLAILIWATIFGLPIILTQETAYVAILILSSIPAIFVFILFTFAYTLLIVRDLGAWEAVKKSVSLVKRNYWSTFGLVILYFLMMGVVGMIPWIGSIANLIILTPSMTIAFVIFVLERHAKSIQ